MTLNASQSCTACGRVVSSMTDECPGCRTRTLAEVSLYE